MRPETTPFWPEHVRDGVRRPVGACGILPLIMAAIGGGRALYGAIDANQKSQRNKGYIEDSYQFAKKKMEREQGLGRENTAEGLGARGMTGLSPIASVMAGNAGTPHTLGDQLQTDNETQYGLERTDLEQQKTRAEQENSAERTGAYIGAALSGAQAAGQAYGASGDLAAINAPSTTGAAIPKPSLITSAMQTNSPYRSFGNIHPIDPLGHPSSMWNSDFHVG